MPALDRPTAVLTLTHVNPKLNPLYPWLRDLGLILGNDLGFLQPTSASWTPRWQRCFQNLVHSTGNSPPTGVTITFSRLASRFLRIGFGWTTREPCSLTLASSQCLFQSAPQTFILRLQFFNLPR